MLIRNIRGVHWPICPISIRPLNDDDPLPKNHIYSWIWSHNNSNINVLEVAQNSNIFKIVEFLGIIAGYEMVKLKITCLSNE